jgi:3-oxoadipate enol-lactonase
MASISAQSATRWFTADFAGCEPETVASFIAELERTDPVGYGGCCLAVAEMGSARRSRLDHGAHVGDLGSR